MTLRRIEPCCEPRGALRGRLARARRGASVAIADPGSRHFFRPRRGSKRQEDAALGTARLGRGTTAACARWATMSSVENIAKPIARAINIYRRVARHELDARTRRELARHIRQLAKRGVKDSSRLTVHGLSYLRHLDMSNESR